MSLPSGARVQSTPPEAVGPQRATSTSPLWTLESLRLEPDDAAANADREENHDPRGERHDEQSDDLTEEMRLENGSELARRIFTSQSWSVQPCVRPVSYTHLTLPTKA